MTTINPTTDERFQESLDELSEVVSEVWRNRDHWRAMKDQPLTPVTVPIAIPEIAD